MRELQLPIRLGEGPRLRQRIRVVPEEDRREENPQHEDKDSGADEDRLPSGCTA
jgi:hypothetical protein